jgi:uncharacterized protein YbbK (DUF523 family)
VGEDKREAVLLNEFKKLFEYIPICPEIEVGMGVPRELVQLIRNKDE